MCRGPFIGFNVAGKLFANARAKDFDSDVRAFGSSCTVHLRDGGCAYGNGVDIFEQLRGGLIQAAVDLCVHKIEWCWWKLVLKRQQITGRFFTDDIRTGGQRLPKLDGRRANGAKGAGIIGHIGLTRPDAGDTAQPLHLRRRVPVSFDAAQRAVPRKNAAPFEQTENMGCGTCHQRGS